MPSKIGFNVWCSWPSPKACASTITWCFLSTAATPLYPCIVPLLVVIFPDSLSVILLFTSFGRFPCPIRGVAVFRKRSILSKCLSKVSIACSSWSLRSRSLGLRRSKRLCSFMQCLIWRWIFSCFCSSSTSFPECSLEASEGILQPSMAISSLPSNPCSSQTSSTCSNTDSMASGKLLTKLAMLVKWGAVSQDKALNIILCSHCHWISRLEVIPFE